MSTKTMVVVSEEDGQVTAVASGYGEVGEGESVSEALTDLAGRLEAIQGTLGDVPTGVESNSSEQNEATLDETGNVAADELRAAYTETRDRDKRVAEAWADVSREANGGLGNSHEWSDW